MSVTEVLQLMESLLYKHNGQEFEDLHKEIITGLLQYKTYREIAEKMNYDPEYVGNISRELYEVLSKELKELGKDEEVKKSNFNTTIEKISNLYSYNYLYQLNCNVFNNEVNLCANDTQKNIKNNSNYVNKCYHDLTLAPQIIKFHNRETELQNITQWILNQNTRLTSILGISGIGKTTLVKRFIDLNLDKFEIIIWKTLKYSKPLTQLLNDLFNTCQQEPKETLDDKIKQLLDILTNNKCLIILDDIQNIFTPGELAGKYQPEYQDYQTLFKLVTETQHQSNIILISQEQCPEMESLDTELYPIKSLELSGLYHPETLQNTGLKNNDSWLDLIKLYAGNMMFLKTITVSIAKNYDGEVAEFLAENTLHITQQMQFHFQETFNRLSPIEQQIVLQLSKFETPISREELRQRLNLSSVDFNNGLQSLQQRYLVSKIKEDKVVFKLSSVFREYVRHYCKDR